MNRKAQEEIVGFVAVVVLVMIIGVIYLTISLRSSEPQAVDSAELRQFLQSTTEYTTECTLGLSNEPLALGRLFEACREKASCGNGKESCAVLNASVRGLIDGGLKPTTGHPLEAFTFTVHYVQNTSQGTLTTPFFTLSKSSCKNSTLRSATEFYPAKGGFIRARLEVCP